MTTEPQTELRPPDPRPFAEEHSVPPPPPRRSWAWIGIAGWVAAATLTVAVGTFWETIVRLRQEIAIRDERLTELAARAGKDQRWLAMVSTPGVRFADMRPEAPGTSSLQGRVVYDPASHRALVVFQGVFPPRGQAYQLWAVRGGVPMDAGVLQPDSTGFAIVRLENMGTPGITEGFAVSVEPRGGSPDRGAPTGPTILQGSLGG
ncbi:MAG TPA: anti-sigma factor [Candidatus Eisenbacteria bacterium]|nr:anti-sigma factor [Candidatus Eisenbacteria bacterium]